MAGEEKPWTVGDLIVVLMKLPHTMPLEADSEVAMDVYPVTRLGDLCAVVTDDGEEYPWDPLKEEERETVEKLVLMKKLTLRFFTV